MNETLIPPVLKTDHLDELLRARPEVRVVDVRTAGEFESVHIRGAYNVPLDALAGHAAEIRAHVNEPVVLVCQSGARAHRAEAALRDSGMTNLHVLAGGVSGWVAEGRPVQRGRQRISLERQVRIAAGSLAATGALLALVVNPLFALLPAFVGSGLVFAGVTDTCAMGLVLARLPYNRPASSDVGSMVRALTRGAPPGGNGTANAPASPPATSCTS